MKIVSPDILHKTDAGGVIVGVKAAAEASRLTKPLSATPRRTSAREDLGVQIQQMLAGGQEVIVGALTDPSFGKVVAFGLGGVLVEVLKDVTFRLAPASEADALSMIDGIAAAEILRGVRGAPRRIAHDRANHRGGVAPGDRFPRDSGARSQPGFRRKSAVAADVRIIVDFAPPASATARPRTKSAR